MCDDTFDLVLDESALQRIGGTTLFYPCSGRDLHSPLTIFAPYCNDFWFVDTAYFGDCLPEDTEPVVVERAGYRWVGCQISYPDIPEGDWKDDKEYDCEKPPIRTDSYCHCVSGRAIRVHRHRRRGPSALRTEIQQLGVFFYRGDSPEGSGTRWLTGSGSHLRKRRSKCLIYEVLDKLVDGGLIVTDGSMCDAGTNPYREFQTLSGQEMVSAEEAVRSVSAFSDDEGREFQCIGCLGQDHHGHGPTMIWQVHRR